MVQKINERAKLQGFGRVTHTRVWTTFTLLGEVTHIHTYTQRVTFLRWSTDKKEASNKGLKALKRKG